MKTFCWWFYIYENEYRHFLLLIIEPFVYFHISLSTIWTFSLCLYFLNDRKSIGLKCLKSFEIKCLKIIPLMELANTNYIDDSKWFSRWYFKMLDISGKKGFSLYAFQRTPGLRKYLENPLVLGMAGIQDFPGFLPILKNPGFPEIFLWTSLSSVLAISGKSLWFKDAHLPFLYFWSCGILNGL